jgi:hypothetical protein
MLAEEFAVGREEDRGTVQRSAVALDHTDDEMCRALTRDVSEHRDRVSRNLDARLPVAAVPLAALGRPVPDDGAKGHPARVRADERLGKHDERCSACRCLARELPNLRERKLAVERDGRRLHHGHAHESRCRHGVLRASMG